MEETRNRGKAQLQISLETSSSKISLHTPTSSLQLIVSAQIKDSSNPTSPITLCTDGSVLDNGQHTRQGGVFRGAFLALESTTDKHRIIPLALHGCVHYGSDPDPNMDLRTRAWIRFETIPAMNKGNLVIKHELSLERIFQYSRNLKATDTQPGEKFRIRANPKRLSCGWWNFGAVDDGGQFAGKRFLRWYLPDENGEIENLMPGDPQPDVEQMESEGWVFNQNSDDLEILEEGGGDGVVIEFVD